MERWGEVTHGRIPTALLADPRVTATDRTVYAAIQSRIDRASGLARVSLLGLAQMVGKSTRTVQRSVASLESAGWLAVQWFHHTEGKASLYRCCPTSERTTGTTPVAWDSYSHDENLDDETVTLSQYRSRYPAEIHAAHPMLAVWEGWSRARLCRHVRAYLAHVAAGDPLAGFLAQCLASGEKRRLVWAVYLIETSSEKTLPLAPQSLDCTSDNAYHGERREHQAQGRGTPRRNGDTETQ